MRRSHFKNFEARIADVCRFKNGGDWERDVSWRRSSCKKPSRDQACSHKIRRVVENVSVA